MYLATFRNHNELKELHKFIYGICSTLIDFMIVLYPSIFAALGNTVGFVDEIYSNGDGTDSWCSTHAIVDTSMMLKNTYYFPLCSEESSCWRADYQNSLATASGLWKTEHNNACSIDVKPRDYTFYFICR
jgi:hypothetical protein